MGWNRRPHGPRGCADCAGTYTVVANGFRFNVVVQDAGGDNIVGFLMSTSEAATPISGTCTGHAVHFTQTFSSFTQIYDGGFWNVAMGGTFSHNGGGGYGWYGIRP